MKELISIDPGLGGTGVCCWRNGKVYNATTLHGYNDHWIDNAEAIMDQISDFISYDRIPWFVEYPVFMSGAGGRMVAAAGDLGKLTFLTGMICGKILNYDQSLTLVRPFEWKGQLPKDVCERRIRSILGEDFPKNKLSNHAVDAIGIGLWAQGRFK